MAFTRSWDESSPAGSAAANTLDTIIQNFKTDIRERLEDSLTNFTNDTDDPKRIVIHNGNEADRPSASDADVSSLVAGEMYFATDTGALFGWDGAAWVELVSGSSATAVVLQDTISNRPAASSVADATLFWATDEDTMYVEESDSWIAVGGSGTGQVTEDRATSVNDDNSAGNQQTATDLPPRILRGRIQGTTDIDGKVFLDLDEVTGSWDANDAILYAAVAASDDLDADNVRVTGINGGNNEIEFTFYVSPGNALGSGTVVAATFVIPFDT